MPQTLYDRPYSEATHVLALFIPCFAGVLSQSLLGIESPVTRIFFAIFFILQLVLVLINPDICIWFTRTNPDGTKVRLKRPLVGFKRYETQVGFTGGYEVRYDGYRYEPALLRI